MPEVVIGKDSVTGERLVIGDIERRSGLYVLGKPGMGKSVLIVNTLNTDLAHGHGAFFLDPHGDAITDLLNRGDSRLIVDARLFDVEDEDFSFGINLLTCKNIKSLKERNETYTRAYNVFYKLWEQEWGPWLQLIIENTLWTFIENQDYTLAEVPMFLNPRNTAFRNHIVKNIKYNSAVAEFWEEDFFQRRDRDQQAMVDAALTRVNTLLNHPYVRDIVGQKKTTVDFSEYLNSNPILLFKLSANLSPDIKKFIGTILVSELLHAVRNRSEGNRNQFCIFVDEFQNFASSDDFTTLITEARKFGIATTIAHVERFGQFAESRKLLGATLAAVNKVFFQLIVPDAQELAPEFADKPDDIKTRLSGELIISPHPVEDIWERGHPQQAIMDMRQRYFSLVDLLRSKPQEKYYQFDPNNLPSDTYKRRELLHQEYFHDWDMYRSSPEMIREGISLLNQYYYDWMNHKYYSGLPISDEEIKIAMKVIECFGGVMGWRPTMRPYIPDDMRDLFRQRLKDYKDKRYEEFANRERAKNRDKDVRYQRWLRDHPTGSGLTIEDLPIDPDALEVIMLQSTHENMYTPEIPSGIGLREIDILRGEALRVGMTSFEMEKLLQWKVRELLEMERNPLEALVRFIANANSESETFQSNLTNLRKDYHTIMARCAIEAGIGSDEYHSLPEEKRFAHLQIMVERATVQSEEILKFVLKCFAHCGPILEKDPVQIPSNRYDEEPKREKTQGEMVDEAAQELANLPRFTAFAKVIEEREGEQTVLKKKIKTLPLPQPQGQFTKAGAVEGYAIAKAHAESKKREDIEKEIRQRQERWRRRERTVSKAPTTEEPSGQP